MQEHVRGGLLLVLFGFASQLVLAQEGPRHEVFFEGFDGSRFEFPAFDKGVFNMLTEKDHQVNSIFAERGAGYATMHGVGIKYKDLLQLLIVTSATVDRPNVLSTLVLGSQRLHTHLKSQLVQRVSEDCEMAYVRKDNGDERVLVQTAEMTIYVVKYADSANLDITVDVTDGKDLTMHGVIGQTYHWVNRPTDRLGPMLEGDESSYLVPGIFDDDFKFNLFEHTLRKR